MKSRNGIFKPFFNPKIELSNAPYGKYVVKLSLNNHQYFQERKEAVLFIKSFTKEI